MDAPRENLRLSYGHRDEDLHFAVAPIIFGVQTVLFSLKLRRVGAFFLLALLALGPFLHAHLGQPQTHGFHMDGLQWHSHAQDLDHTSFTADDDHESPAIGVTSSLTRESSIAPQPQDLMGWACALVLMVLPVLVTLTIRRTYRSPLPKRPQVTRQLPPALASPTAR